MLKRFLLRFDVERRFFESGSALEFLCGLWRAENSAQRRKLASIRDPSLLAIEKFGEVPELRGIEILDPHRSAIGVKLDVEPDIFSPEGLRQRPEVFHVHFLEDPFRRFGESIRDKVSSRLLPGYVQLFQDLRQAFL